MASFRGIHMGAKTSWQRTAQEWQAVCDQWSDPVQEDFEKEFWQPLTVDFAATMGKLEELTNIVEKAQRTL